MKEEHVEIGDNLRRIRSKIKKQKLLLKKTAQFAQNIVNEAQQLSAECRALENEMIEFAVFVTQQKRDFEEIVVMRYNKEDDEHKYTQMNDNTQKNATNKLRILTNKLQQSVVIAMQLRDSQTKYEKLVQICCGETDMNRIIEPIITNNTIPNTTQRRTNNKI
eukprot:784467_1